MAVWNWIMENYGNIFAIIGGLITVAMMVVRLTPTATDDGFLAKVDGWFNTICDFLKIPNPRA